MTTQNCFICLRQEVPLDQWDQSLKILVELKLCQKHKEYVDKRIIETSKKVYTLKSGEPKTVFMPPVVEEQKSFYEREPNDGSLIE